MSGLKERLSGMKEGGRDAYSHLKGVVGELVLGRGGIDDFERVSFQTRIGPPVDNVLTVRESYNLIRDFETAHRSLLGVRHPNSENQHRYA